MFLHVTDKIHFQLLGCISIACNHYSHIINDSLNVWDVYKVLLEYNQSTLTIINVSIAQTVSSTW